MGTFDSMRNAYGLKRSNFNLDPRTDWMCYFGRADFESKLNKVISGKLRSGQAPKIVVWGDWGWGKTQTLFHFMNTIMTGDSIPIYVECTEFPEKSGFLNFYQMLMEGLGKELLVEIVKSVHRSDPTGIQQIQDRNLRHICTNIIPSPVSESVDLAWSWIAGRLPKGKSSTIGVDSESLTVEDCVNTLITIGQLAVKGMGKPIIYLVDEAHRLKNIEQESDYEREYFYAFRRLFMPKVFVGFVFAIGVGVEKEIPHVFSYAEVTTRLSDYFTNLPPYSENDVKEFITNTIRYVRDGWDSGSNSISQPDENVKSLIQSAKKQNHSVTEESYPFTTEALNQLYEYFRGNEAKANPREITDILTECASEESAITQAVVTEETVVGVLTDRAARTPLPEQT